MGYDFAEVSKIVEAGATSKPVKDYELSRYACYPTVQNGDRRSAQRGDCKRDAIDSPENANSVHHAVGREVRAAIERVGGTMPEDLPTPKKSIAELEKEQLAELKRRAKQKPLMLDE